MADPSAPPFAHPMYTHRDGSSCLWLHGTWFVPLDAGGEGHPCPQQHPTDDLAARLRATEDALTRLIAPDAAARDELARHRQEHQPDTGAAVCACRTWEGPYTLHVTDSRSYAHHLLSALTATPAAP